MPVHVALDAGPLRVDISTSTAAQLFHIVDQMSGWSVYCHPQFKRRLGPFSPRDEALLAKHAALRKAHGYGVLDQTFYPAHDWRSALEHAVNGEKLTRKEAADEREVLERFQAIVSPLIDSGVPAIESSIAKLTKHAEELEAFARRASRFTQQAELHLPLYLVPSGERTTGGGGANGGVLVVEVGEDGDPYFTLLHEAWHAFVDRRVDALDAAVQRTPGLDRTLLGEGMAYAIYPGLYHPGAGDELRAKVRNDLADSKTHDDERFRRYAMFNRYGLALRPLLEAALDDPNETLQTFLPRACDVFRALESLNTALEGRAIHGIFLFGPTIASLRDRAASRRVNVWGRRHDRDGYRVLANARPNDLVLLLFTLKELSAGIPDEVRDLLPIPLEQVKASLSRGEPIEAGAARREWQVILLAAPDEAGIAALARASKALERALLTGS